MRKIFFGMFFRIFAIACLVILIHTALELLQYNYSVRRFNEQSFEMFVSALEDGLGTMDRRIQLDDVMNAVSEDRVSGFIIRKNDSGRSLAVGNTPGGFEILCTPSSETKAYRVRRAVRVSIDVSGDDVLLSTEQLKKCSISFPVPDNLKKSDFIGSVIISVKGEDSYYIDVIGYSPRTFDASRLFVLPWINSLLISIPVCLLLSMLLALRLARKTTVIIVSIRNSLQNIAVGLEEIEVDSIDEYPILKEVYQSIVELQKDLSRAEKTKLLWLNGLSHELNTPATAIKIMIEGINGGVFEKSPENLQALERECDILIDRIRTVMDVTSSDEKLRSAVAIDNPQDLF